jgi:hypothetical protein
MTNISDKVEISDETLDHLLAYDPVSSAEQQIDRISQPKEFEALALDNAMDVSLSKKIILADRRDTHYGATPEYLHEVYAENGFELVYDEPFERIDKFDPNETVTEEHLRVWAHRDGLILIDQTYSWLNEDGSLHVGYNAGHLYYNFVYNEGVPHTYSLTSTGGFAQDPEKEKHREAYYEMLRYEKAKSDDPRWSKNPYHDARVVPYVWCGNHDTREGMIHIINNFRKHGSFLKKWIDNPIPWIITTEEHVKDEDRFVKGAWDIWRNKVRELSKERLSKMPDWVQEMVGEFK